MSFVCLSYEGRAEPIEVGVQQLSDRGATCHAVKIDGVQSDVELDEIAPGVGILRVRGQVIPYHVLRRRDVISVHMLGRTYTFTIAGRAAARDTGAPADPGISDLTAPMPGTILTVQVASGDAFEAHQPLFILESMKMEMTISAPAAGRVKEVVCAEGQLVEMGALLARLEAPDGQ